MKLPVVVSIFAFGAGLLAGPLVFIPAAAGPPNTEVPGTAPDAALPDQDSQLQNALANLQTRVQRLQSQVAILSTHKHAYRYWTPPPGQYVSIAELRDALASHSGDVATTWIAVTVASSRPASNAGAEHSSMTDGPTAAP